MASPAKFDCKTYFKNCCKYCPKGWEDHGRNHKNIFMLPHDVPGGEILLNSMKMFYTMLPENRQIHLSVDYCSQPWSLQLAELELLVTVVLLQTVKSQLVHLLLSKVNITGDWSLHTGAILKQKCSQTRKSLFEIIGEIGRDRSYFHFRGILDLNIFE